jgi:hypothetical protein
VGKLFESEIEGGTEKGREERERNEFGDDCRGGKEAEVER